MLEPARDDLQSAFLKVAVVGPTHPYKGGIALHTTALAHNLQRAGHDVTLVSWSHLLPPALYDGDVHVPGGVPESEPFPRTVRALSWARPDTWVRTGRRLRAFDAIVLVHVIPAVVPAHLALLRGAGTGRPDAGGTRHGAPRSVLVCHNVLPHEPHVGDRELVGSMFRRVDAVLVHSAEQAGLAQELGAGRACVADLPPHLPAGGSVERPEHTGPARLLALGMVREYKGVDLLLEALREVPEVRLTIAGEMLGEHAQRIRGLAADPALAGRVVIRDEYVPAEALADLLAEHDVLTLTYRHSTASQNVLLGHVHGLPVLASDVGVFGQQVRDGVDGILVPPGDERALAGALRRLTDPALLARLRAGVDRPDLSTPWASYVGAVEALASPDAGAEETDHEETDHEKPHHEAVARENSDREAAAPTRHTLLARGRAAALAVRTLRRPVVELTRADLPDWLMPSDVLGDAADADEAAATARSLKLPRASDATAAWAALGALAAIVRVGDDGRRHTVIVDESGARSPLSRWARVVGFAPVDLGLTRRRASVAALEVDPGALDVIARVHPGGCDADDVDETLAQASWALRSGGLLILTVPLGPAGADGAFGPADVRGITARAHDLGFVLVGDLDGDVNARMMQASATATASDTAYGLVRLTLRRR